MSKDTRRGESGPTVEVAFAITDSAYPFVAATEAEPCVCELAEMVPRTGGEYAEFFNVTGTKPGRIVDLATTHDALEVSLLREFEDGGLFEFLTSGDCPAVTLAEHGALPREVVSEDGEGRILAEIPPQYDPGTVVEPFIEEHPEAELTSKQEKDTFSSLFTDSAVEETLRDRLTDRQREVMRTAYEMGYYEWPRECTGEDVAETLGVSSATFSEHIRTAERALLAILVEGR